MDVIDEHRLDPESWLVSYGDALFGYALARTHDRSSAEDLVQETLLAAIKNQHTYSGQAKVRTWLIGILRHKIADYFEKKTQLSHLPDTELQQVMEDQMFNRRGHWRSTLRPWPTRPDETLEDREFWIVFDKCCAKLPPILSEAFVLRDLEQHETEEICQQLGISASNLAVRVHRARLAIRQCLDRNWFGRK